MSELKTVAFLSKHEIGPRGASINFQEKEGWCTKHGSDKRTFVLRYDNSGLKEKGSLWDEFLANLKQFDHVFVYINNDCTENDLLEALRRIPRKKLTLVLCHCNYEDSNPRKLRPGRLKEAGLIRTPRIVCECGGFETMHFLITKFRSPWLYNLPTGIQF